MAPETSTQNRRIAGMRALTSPRRLRDQLPLKTQHEETVVRGRLAVTSILNRNDDRIIVVVGPCSLHDPSAGLEYARRLADLAHEVEGELCVVMRTYFEKPRTTIGWKGLINDPGLDGSFRVNEGLSTARAFLLDVLGLDLPVGCEFLDPITAEYLADAVSWPAASPCRLASRTRRKVTSKARWMRSPRHEVRRCSPASTLTDRPPSARPLGIRTVMSSSEAVRAARTTTRGACATQ